MNAVSWITPSGQWSPIIWWYSSRTIRQLYLPCAPKRNTTKRQRLPKYEQLVDAFCRGDECGRRAPASLELASPNYREYQEQYYCQAQLPGHNEPCYSCLNSCACLCGRGEATPRAT